MESQSVAPFENIECAQEYLTLLAEAITESRQMVEEQMVEADLDARGSPGVPRHLDVLRVIVYNLEKLTHHVKISRRILNDLRTLRRLLHQERTHRTTPVDTAA